MKKLIVLSLVAVAAAAVATNQGAEKFLASKLDEWFAEAKPVGQGLFVTDKEGCLHSVIQGDQGLSLVAMLDKAKKPICRK
jgi:hypothetical protein